MKTYSENSYFIVIYSLMTKSGVNSEGFPTGGEFLHEEITIESRFPHTVMPVDNLWPVRLHDEATKSAVAEVLPEFIATLSVPIKPATESQISDLFASNPHDRRTPWISKRTDEGLIYSTAAYEGREDANGNNPIHYGINYTFDVNGRLIKREYNVGKRPYQRHHANFQEYLAYDDDGYLIERTTWSQDEATFTDSFEYNVAENGSKTPAQMTRTLRVSGDGFSYGDSVTMTVDLANYEEWLATNPNGFTALAREQLNPKKLEIRDFSVSEHRRGIFFSHPEQLENALVMYGDGSYPTHGDKTALEHNDVAFAEVHDSLGGALFSLVARSSDMRKFVHDRITNKVQEKRNQILKNITKASCESVQFGFDEDGVGNFHNTNGVVTITQEGLELTLSSDSAGDNVEDLLASAMQTKRGLRSATINVPINQTERDGYFFVDVKAACEELGIPISAEAVTKYLGDYLFENDETPISSYDRKNVKQPSLWEDEATGVTVDFIVERHDINSDTDLVAFIRHDNTAIWGPLPKEVHGGSEEGLMTPKLRVIVMPAGDPFAPETTEHIDEIVRGYMRKLLGGFNSSLSL